MILEGKAKAFVLFEYFIWSREREGTFVGLFGGAGGDFRDYSSFGIEEAFRVIVAYYVRASSIRGVRYWDGFLGLVTNAS